MPEARPTVLVTRPQPGAEATVKRLETAGLQPVHLPLTEIAPVAPDADLQAAAKADATAVTSANALRHAPSALLETLRRKPAYVVGAATAATARECGFTDIRCADGNVENLAGLIADTAAPQAKMIYLAGQRRAGDLEGKLEREGFHVDVFVMYEAEKVSEVTEKLQSALVENTVAGILFHSSYSARVFADCIGELKGDHLVEKTLIFTISERVAAPLPAAWNPRILVARKPTDEALVDMAVARLIPDRA